MLFAGAAADAEDALKTWCNAQAIAQATMLCERLYPEVQTQANHVPLSGYDWKCLGTCVRHFFLLCKRMRKEGFAVKTSAAPTVSRMLRAAILGQTQLIVGAVSVAMDAEDWSTRKLTVSGQSRKSEPKVVCLTSSGRALYAALQDFMVCMSPVLSRHFASTQDAAGAVGRVIEESMAYFAGRASDALRSLKNVEGCLGIIADLFFVGSDLCDRAIEHFKKVSRVKLERVEHVQRTILGSGFIALAIRTYTERQAQQLVLHLIVKGDNGAFKSLETAMFVNSARRIYEGATNRVGSSALAGVILDDIVDRVMAKLVGATTSAAVPVEITSSSVDSALGTDVPSSVLADLEVIAATPGLLKEQMSDAASPIAAEAKRLISSRYAVS